MRKPSFALNGAVRRTRGRVVFLSISSAITFVAVLAGCGGNVNTTAIATPSAPPPRVLSVKPTTIQLLGIGSSNATNGLLQETGYSGPFTEGDTCSGIATVTPSSGTGPALAFSVTGAAAGNCNASFSDNVGGHVSIAIAVTLVSGSVQ